jgi:hypothetical protein
MRQRAGEKEPRILPFARLSDKPLQPDEPGTGRGGAPGIKVLLDVSAANRPLTMQFLAYPQNLCKTLWITPLRIWRTTPKIGSGPDW